MAQMNLLEATPPIDPLRLYTLKVERLEHENDCFQDRFISFPRADFHVLNSRGVYILKLLPSLNKSPLDLGFIYA